MTEPRIYDTIEQVIALLPEAASDGGDHDLRRWNFRPNGEMVLNLDTAAKARKGLVRPCLHNSSCRSLRPKEGPPKPLLTDGPFVSLRAAYALWGEERSAQPQRRVWFCEVCLTKQVVR